MASMPSWPPPRCTLLLSSCLLDQSRAEELVPSMPLATGSSSRPCLLPAAAGCCQTRHRCTSPCRRICPNEAGPSLALPSSLLFSSLLSTKSSQHELPHPRPRFPGTRDPASEILPHHLAPQPKAPASHRRRPPPCPFASQLLYRGLNPLALAIAMSRRTTEPRSGVASFWFKPSRASPGTSLHMNIVVPFHLCQGQEDAKYQDVDDPSSSSMCVYNYLRPRPVYNYRGEYHYGTCTTIVALDPTTPPSKRLLPLRHEYNYFHDVRDDPCTSTLHRLDALRRCLLQSFESVQSVRIRSTTSEGLLHAFVLLPSWISGTPNEEKSTSTWQGIFKNCQEGGKRCNIYSKNVIIIYVTDHACIFHRVTCKIHSIHSVRSVYSVYMVRFIRFFGLYGINTSVNTV